jgi:hypothetical protein
LYVPVNFDALQIVKNVGATFAAWGLGTVFAVFAALLLNLFQYPMPFYSHPSFVYALFGIPVIVGQVLAFSYLLKDVEDQTWMAIKTTVSNYIYLYILTA